MAPPPCPVCDSDTALHGVVDFNKSCEEAKQSFLDLSGVPIYYALCSRCGFCFAPEMHGWSPADFKDRVYNDHYVLADPDYADQRPRSNAAALIALFKEQDWSPNHIDYGGGNGLTARLLAEAGWMSRSYDPFVDTQTDVTDVGQADLVTAFEVFEHVPDVRGLMRTLRAILNPGGIIVFTTMLSDGQITRPQGLAWWYAAPRNGHVSLFSSASLAVLAADHGFRVAHLSLGTHVFFTEAPAWARHLIAGAPVEG